MTEEEQKNLTEEIKKKYLIGFPLCDFTLKELKERTKNIQEKEFKFSDDPTEKKKGIENVLSQLNESVDNIGLWISYYNWCVLNKAICVPRQLPNQNISFQTNATTAIHKLGEDDLDKIRAYLESINKELLITNSQIEKLEKAIKEVDVIQAKQAKQAKKETKKDKAKDVV